MEGMNLNADSNEGKLFLAIADVLDEIALEVEDLTDEVMELGDGLDVISDDLSDVEDVVFDEDDYEELDDEDEDDEEEECYATTCPECEEEIFFDDSVLEDRQGRVPQLRRDPSNSTPPISPRTRKRTTKRPRKSHITKTAAAPAAAVFLNFERKKIERKLFS